MTIREIMRGKEVQFQDNNDNKKEFLRICEEEGITWNGGACATVNNYRINDVSFIKMDYNSNVGLTHGSEIKSYKTINLQELKRLLKYTFTKDDLRDWQVVELRDGSFNIVNATKGIIDSDSGFVDIDNYDKNLMRVDKINSEFDIMSVYDCKSISLLCSDAYKDSDNLTLIWERIEETKEEKRKRELKEELENELKEIQDKAKSIEIRLSGL